MKSRLGPGGKLALGVNALFLFGINLSNTYVSIFLWKASNSLATVAWYHVYQYIGLFLGTLLAGRFAEANDRTTCLRTGVVLHALFFAAVLFFGADAGLHAPRLGLLLGVGAGFYWLGSNVLSFDLTDEDNVDYFHGLFSVYSSLAVTIAPFLAGWLILQFPELLGYRYLFASSLALFVATILLSLFLYTRSSDGEFTLRPVIIPDYTGSDWPWIFVIQFLNGFRNGVFVFLIGILVYRATGSEFGIGVYSLLTGTVTFVASYVVGRYVLREYRKHSIVWGQVASVAATLALVISPNVIGIAVFGFLEALAFPIYGIPFGALCFDLIDEDPKAAARRVEYMVAREIPLNAGRLAGLAGFLLVGAGILDAPFKRALVLIVYGTIPALGLIALRNIES